jgi:recombination protein RecR
MFTGKLAHLEQNLKKLPGIGSKSAQRLAMYILSMEKKSAIELGNSIIDAVESYRECEICNMFTEESPCEFCTDTKRNDSLICIVESSKDVFLIDSTHEYQGRFFVLNHLLSPLDGIGPKEIHFPTLKKLLLGNSIQEVILALNPSIEGESTMHFLATQLRDIVPKITRLATGLPFGSDMEYTSTPTLLNAFKRRFQVKD